MRLGFRCWCACSVASDAKKTPLLANLDRTAKTSFANLDKAEKWVEDTLLQHAKELVLHSDLRPEDRMLFYTTCGWMMWNWMVSSLFAGDAPTLDSIDAVYLTRLQAERGAADALAFALQTTLCGRSTCVRCESHIHS